MPGGRTIRAALKRLRHSEGGAAVVEFALILPVMLMVYLGTLEASLLIITDRKVQSTAGAVGDLVARSDQTISTGTMLDYFRAAGSTMQTHSLDDLLQVVTAVAVDADGNPTVVWTRQFDGNDMSSTTPYTVGDEYPLPQEMIDISRGRMVIAAEARYSYPPVTNMIFDNTVSLFRSSFFLPRFGGTITLTP